MVVLVSRMFILTRAAVPSAIQEPTAKLLQVSTIAVPSAITLKIAVQLWVSIAASCAH